VVNTQAVEHCVSVQVRNIVHGSRDALERLYAQRFTDGPVAEAAGLAPQQPQSWQQASCEASRAALLLQLPMVGGHAVAQDCHTPCNNSSVLLL
jgi:hypothetical protein